MKLHLIAGARPNFMKIAPLWHGLQGHHMIHTSFIHMAQHRDQGMSSDIWRDLGLPDPDHILEWDAAAGQDPVAAMMAGYESLCRIDRPDAVLVVGDVNASLAAAMIASEMHIPLIHLEAGLRCFDQKVPEEANRIRIDHIANLLLTPSPDADTNLLNEGISPDRIKRVGNIMIDTLVMMKEAVNREQIANKFGLDSGPYVVATFHRPSNVDNSGTLSRIVKALCEIASILPVCLPLHPRTEQQLIRLGGITKLEHAGVKCLPPMGYVRFGSLVQDARLVITDSGGVQEETSWLGIPCLTLRPSTERPMTVTHGTNRLVCPDDLTAAVIDLVRDHRDTKHQRCQIPLWDGATTARVIIELERFCFAAQVTK